MECLWGTDRPATSGAVLALRRPLATLAALALPPRCPGCGEVVAADHSFCAACWSGLRFITPPWCAGCGVPFEFDSGADFRCDECLSRPPSHDGVRAAVAYGEIARRLALRLKYGGRTALATTVARHMSRLVPDGAELLVPVPLHRWRLLSRGFNQAALIATALARRGGPPTALNLLRRTKRTPLLRGLGRTARARAVRGAFAVDPRGAGRLAGRHVVLVDDVYTSGATTDACVAMLRRAGAARVTILCWARVLDGSD